jgi:hypothetical protein
MKQGAPTQIHLALLSLKDVSAAILSDLHAGGKGKLCGVCHKKFGVLRKESSVARVTHCGESGILLSTWLLCRKCHHAARRDGRLPHQLVQEAREAYEDLRLMQTSAQGSA